MAMRNILRLLLVFLITFTLPGCQGQPAFTPLPEWKYTDLRALDATDEIPPSQDLIALYIRRLDDRIEIRIDLLDISTPLDCDIYLTITSSLYKESIRIAVPASGGITAQDANGVILKDLYARLIRDTFLDNVVISLKRSSLTYSGLPFEVQAATTLSASSTRSDQIGPVRSDASPPPQAKVLLAFWNTFPAYTPAQALRLWDGAHSGPGRSRFGLRHLLNAVEVTGVPVFLLDLKTPTAFSTLDFMGVLPEILNLAESHAVILPDTYPFNFNPLTTLSIPGSNLVDIPTSSFLYTTIIPSQLSSSHRILFTPSKVLIPPDQPNTYPYLTHVYRWQDQILIPIPDEKEAFSSIIPTPSGPSLRLQQALVLAALNPQAGILLLGGELAQTSWGDPECIMPTLRYLVAHPWIHFITADELLTMKTKFPILPRADYKESNETVAEKILPNLFSAPKNPITDLAWQTYLSLLTPASAELTELRAEYFGIVGHLLAAAQWSAQPTNMINCSKDIDWDEQAECIMASPNFFATFEINGGYIVVAFSRNADGIHQIIAPYSQFIVGLSDPSIWNPHLGIEADPALVPGGFVDPVRSWQAELLPGQINFTDVDNNQNKTFQLTDTGLRAEYFSLSPMTVKISIGLDPWQRFSLGWGKTYQEFITSDSWEWILTSGPHVALSTSADLTVQAFTASQPYLDSPEDPNFEYPAGHYIPFPLALVEITGEKDFYIELSIIHE